MLAVLGAIHVNGSTDARKPIGPTDKRRRHAAEMSAAILLLQHRGLSAFQFNMRSSAQPFET